MNTLHKTRGTISALTILALFCVGASAQSRRRVARRVDESAIRRMLENQPDYTAVMQFIFDEGFGGFGATSKVAKLGRRMREENDEYIFLHELGKPTIRLDPKRKEYAEMPADDEEKEDPATPVTPGAMAGSDGVIFRMLGTTKVGKYGCRKIEVTYKNQRLKGMKYILCVAPSLNNLIVFEQAFLPPRVKITQVLSDVSLGASEDLFSVPADYKKVALESPGELLNKSLEKMKRPTPTPTPDH